MTAKKSVFEKIKIPAKKIFAVASGKGGVGKTTVAVNLALALAGRDQKVGILDADIYGPNVPLMLGIQDQSITMEEDQLVPMNRHGLDIISVAFITRPEQALIWRGPLANKLIEQFLRDVRWQQMDCLIIDLPPGTGDVPLSIVQKVELSAGLIVTTPQKAALADVRKMINMFSVTKTPILGIVENMTHLICPECGKTIDLYPGSETGKGQKKLGHPVVAGFPFLPELNRPGEKLFHSIFPDSPVVKEYRQLADRLMKF